MTPGKPRSITVSVQVANTNAVSKGQRTDHRHSLEAISGRASPRPRCKKPDGQSKLGGYSVAPVRRLLLFGALLTTFALAATAGTVKEIARLWAERTAGKPAWRRAAYNGCLDGFR